MRNLTEIMMVALVVVAALFAGCLGLKGRGEIVKLPDNAVLLDVRQPGEFNAGHIAGAVLVPHDTIKDKIASVVPNKETPVYVYCRSGRRSAMAVRSMRSLGYTNLIDLGGMAEARDRLGK